MRVLWSLLLLATVFARCTEEDIPSMAERFEAELLRLLDEVWVEEDLLGQVDLYADLIAKAQQSDEGYADITALRTFIRDRPDQIHKLLAPGVPVPDPGTPGCMDWLEDETK